MFRIIKILYGLLYKKLVESIKLKQICGRQKHHPESADMSSKDMNLQR